MSLVGALEWASALGCAGGLVAYVWAFIVRPKGDRRFPVLGLFFTALALGQLPLFLRNGAQAGGLMNAALAVVCLLAAVASQAAAALRGRAPRDPAARDRRGDAAA